MPSQIQREGTNYKMQLPNCFVFGIWCTLGPTCASNSPFGNTLCFILSDTWCTPFLCVNSWRKQIMPSLCAWFMVIFVSRTCVIVILFYCSCFISPAEADLPVHRSYQSHWSEMSLSTAQARQSRTRTTEENRFDWGRQMSIDPWPLRRNCI